MSNSSTQARLLFLKFFLLKTFLKFCEKNIRIFSKISGIWDELLIRSFNKSLILYDLNIITLYVTVCALRYRGERKSVG